MLRRAWVLCVVTLLALLGLDGGGQALEASDRNRGATYENPFELPDEWPAYGVGDPFILRWNGRFYLYPSTNTHYGGSVGIKAWSSVDLVNWEYEGLVTEDPISHNAFAPEVVYWNGTFYMYTSPDGQGHYVFTSKSPTGPFTAVTGNLGLSIDGSVFIDDDGSWTFTRAGHLGIRGHHMSNPFTIGPERVLNSSLGAWTEGPYILKRNGLYYLTYAGNHLLSPGYRVHYSISETGPLGPYTIPENDLLIISTKEGFSGLGHSATVLGPDLDSYYIVYHNMPKRTGHHLRKMNIDRLVFNGRKMAVLGPTDYPQPAPKMPELYTWIDEEGLGDRWEQWVLGDTEYVVSLADTADVYTAEYNLEIPRLEEADQSAFVSGLFAYQDPKHYGYIKIAPKAKRLELAVVEGGIPHILATVDVLPELHFGYLHTVRVAKGEETLKVFLDNMLQVEVPATGIGGGRIGYAYAGVEPILRYTAFANDADGSSDFDVYKPVPGSIEAVHYKKTDGHGVASPVSDGAWRRADGTRIRLTSEGVYAITLSEPAEWLAYNINVEQDGVYGAAFTVSQGTDAVVEAIVDGAVAATWHLHFDPSDSEAEWIKVPVGEMKLEGGLHELTLRIRQGRLDVTSMEFYRITPAAYALSDSLTGEVGPEWSTFGEAGWQTTNTGLRTIKQGPEMAIVGDRGWTDYRVEVDLHVHGQIYPGDAGVLVRATEPSYFPDQVPDAVIGYYVAFDGERLTLRRLRYGSQTVASVAVPSGTASHHIAVEAFGPTIRVYWDRATEPAITYTDPNAFLHGAVGLRSSTTAISFTSLNVTCLSCPAFGQIVVGDQPIWIQPAQAEYTVRLPFAAIAPPEIRVVPNEALTSARLVDAKSSIEVIPAATLPGEASVQVVGQNGELLHRARIRLEKETVPPVTLTLPGTEMAETGFVGKVRGDVPVVLQTEGPSSLITDVQLTLARVELGEPVDPVLLYSGTTVPERWILNTLGYPDATYELTGSVSSVYGTKNVAAVRFRVENWTEMVDELEAPISSWFGVISREKMWSKTEGWAHATDRADHFFGDGNRMVRMANTTEALAWEWPGLRHFTLTLYAQEPTVDESLVVEASEDGIKWWPLAYTPSSVQSEAGDWWRIELTGDVGGIVDANYLRVTLLASDLQADQIQVGRVRLVSLATE